MFDPSTGRILHQQWRGLWPLEACRDDVVISYLGEHGMHTAPPTDVSGAFVRRYGRLGRVKS